jgi:hypothetical protein
MQKTRLVQSFWSKPFAQSLGNTRRTEGYGGWMLKKYNYFSIALSCLQLCSFYDCVELITDEMGRYLLIEKMGLPYTSVRVELNQLDKFDSCLWALGKIYAYRVQDGPFLHVDNDLFIWKAFEDRIMEADLTAQNAEFGVKEYADTFKVIASEFSYLPSCFQKLAGASAISCANAGIMGGSNLDFFQKYASEVFTFVERNTPQIREKSAVLHSGNLNIVCEQVLFYMLARTCNARITYLFPESERTPRSLGYFHAAAQNRGIVHALSYYKKRKIVYSLLEEKMRTLYPSYYDHILKLMNAAEI